jgi:hypothetical protein
MNKVFTSTISAVAFAMAASVLAAGNNAPVPAPELVPELPSRDNARVSQKDSTATLEDEGTKQGSPEIVVEERVESRLAIIRSGRYVVTDPNVGRYDRAASNGQRRVTPSMWQVFRF